MATITKRGDNWRVQVRRKGHKPLYGTFTKKVLAEKWAREMETAVEQGKFHANDPDLGVVLQRYIDEVLPIKPMQRTHHATMRTLRRKSTGTLVSGITAQWMLDFAKGRDVAPSTLDQEFIFIAMALRHADTFWEVRPDWDEWKRGRHALRSYGLTGRSVERSRRVSDSEIEEILDNMKSTLPMDELIAFSIDTAVRVAELCRIRWSDLDEEKRTIVIRDRKHPTLKKGNHQTIPLLGRSFDIIKRQVRQRGEIFPYKTGSIGAAWCRAVERAGLVDLRWHDLRHEGICRLFEAGYEIQEVALVSGHRDWNMLRRYTHLSPEKLHDKAMPLAVVEQEMEDLMLDEEEMMV